MKKKRLFLLLILCVGLFMPRGVFAYRPLSSDILDYHIMVDYYVDGEESKKYQLHDEKNYFVFQSEYDTQSNRQHFSVDSTKSFKDYNSDFYDVLYNVADANHETYTNLLLEYPKFYGTKFDIGGNGYYCSDCRNSFWSSMMIVPMILEEIGNDSNKKIVFATIHNSVYYIQRGDRGNDSIISLYEFTLTNSEQFNIVNNLNPSNIEFMTNAIYDYSDGLWQELNNTNCFSRNK